PEHGQGGAEVARPRCMGVQLPALQEVAGRQGVGLGVEALLDQLVGGDVTPELAVRDAPGLFRRHRLLRQVPRPASTPPVAGRRPRTTRGCFPGAWSTSPARLSHQAAPLPAEGGERSDSIIRYL